MFLNVQIVFNGELVTFQSFSTSKPKQNSFQFQTHVWIINSQTFLFKSPERFFHSKIFDKNVLIHENLLNQIRSLWNGLQNSNWLCPTHIKARSAMWKIWGTSSACFHVKVWLCCDFCRGSPIKSSPLVIRWHENILLFSGSLGKSSFEGEFRAKGTKGGPIDVTPEQCRR